MSLHLNQQCQRAQKARQHVPPHLSGGYPLSSLFRKRRRTETGHRRDKRASTSDSFSRQHQCAILFQLSCKTAFGCPDTSVLRGNLLLMNSTVASTGGKSTDAQPLVSSRKRFGAGPFLAVSCLYSLSSLRPPFRCAPYDV